MTATISAFGWVPDFARGHVRDLRVRWALEEAGRPYDEHFIDGDMQESAAYRQWQPFGQVPAYRDDTVSLFESGAIVLYLAEGCEALMPRDPAGARGSRRGRSPRSTRSNPTCWGWRSGTSSSRTNRGRRPTGCVPGR